MLSTCHNWNDLSDVVDAGQLNNKDNECLSELQSVIEKFGLERKFGVSLLHKHFDIGPDEMMVESNSPKDRTLVVKPVSIDQVEPDQLITTNWRFDNGMRYGCAYCKKDHCQR